MLTTLLTTLKSVFLWFLLGVIVFLAGYAYFKGKQVENREKVITTQAEQIKAKQAEISHMAGQIEQYKTDIEAAKRHEKRVAVIRKVEKVIGTKIEAIQDKRKLTDEEKIVAADIADLFNGGMLQDGNGSSDGGKVLPDSGKAGTE